MLRIKVRDNNTGKVLHITLSEILESGGGYTIMDWHNYQRAINEAYVPAYTPKRFRFKGYRGAK